MIAVVSNRAVKATPPDHQNRNVLAIVGALFVGVGLLTAVSMKPGLVDKDALI